LINPAIHIQKYTFELRFGYLSLIKLFKFILQSKAEVVVVKNIDSVFSIFSMMIARILLKKIIIFLQVDKFRIKPISYSILLTKIFFNAQVITPLLGDPKYSNKNNNLHYLPFVQKNQVLESEISQKTFDYLKIICVGKFQKRKNQLQLLNVLNEIKDQCNFCLHLIGQRGDDQYLEDLKSYIDRNNLQEKVEIKLELNWEQMREEYKWANLYILPSFKEPASVSLLEAMSFGLPVICTDQNGTKCYIQGNGFIYENKNEQDLAAIILELYNNKIKLMEMSLRSLDLVRTFHSQEAFYKNFIKIIKRS